MFWRAFLELKKRNNGVNPQFKAIWEAVYEEWEEWDQLEILEKVLYKHKFDESSIIYHMNSKDSLNAVMRWFIEAENCGGDYHLVSLSSLLTGLKKKPPF